MPDVNETPTDQAGEETPVEPQVEQAKSNSDWNALQKQLRLAKKEIDGLKDATERTKADELSTLEERGKYKEINTMLKENVTDLTTRLSEAQEIAIKYADIESQQRVKALEKLPEKFRKYGETMDLTSLLDFVDDHSKKIPVTDNDLPAPRESLSRKDFNKLNIRERKLAWGDFVSSYRNKK